MTPATTPDRTGVRAGRDGFAQLLRAEWTKFRTVRGWVIGMLVAGSVIVGLGLFPGMQGSCGQSGPASACTIPVGPGGQEVTDNFYFVHQPLAGNGSITIRVTSLTGLLPTPPAGRSAPVGTRPGLVPWAKAGLIVKDGTRQGSAYAAILVTGAHGVRMQHDYTHDVAGQPGPVSAASPRWLRLTRSGDTITGTESADGNRWTIIGTAHLAGLPTTVQAGLFAASPQYAQPTSQSFVLTGDAGGPTQATAAFDHLSRQGTWPSQAWTGEDIGGPDNATSLQRGGFDQAGGGFTVSGSGDIAPAGGLSGGMTITQTLVGAFAGLIMVIVVGTLFITAEYRRGLIRTTLAASPRRGRVLAAKAIVIGAVTYLTGLIAAAAVVVPLGGRILRSNGNLVYPVGSLTELRVVAGTAALVAVAAVLALAVGTMLRRSAAAVTAVIGVIVLPYVLAVATVLPAGAAQWLLRLTPAAAFAIQQSTPRYPQVSALYTPANGYFPLAPWSGFAVLCAWAALALGLAIILLRRRDACGRHCPRGRPTCGRRCPRSGPSCAPYQARAGCCSPPSPSP